MYFYNRICSPIENFDTKKNELTRQGFLELNLMEANDREGDPRDLWLTLEAMGYKPQFRDGGGTKVFETNF